jgi:hypothetical protein
MGSRFIAIKNDVKLHTWDIEDDKLGRYNPKEPHSQTTVAVILEQKEWSSSAYLH